MIDAPYPNNIESTAFISKHVLEPTGRGVLSNKRVAVKDNINTAGVATTGGTKFLRDHIPEADARVVAQIREQGAVVVGKTNMHELGHGITGLNPTFGPTLNPFNPAYTVGGSSGGSALAVACLQADFALGTDTGGSIRIPAAYTGTVGYRPSTGRYSAEGIISISPTRDTVGVIAKTVAQIKTVDRVLSPCASRKEIPAELRIGVYEEGFERLPYYLFASYQEALEKLENIGITLVRISASRQLKRCFELGFTLLMHETGTALQDYLGPQYGVEALRDLAEASESLDVRAILMDALKQEDSPYVLENTKRELHAIHREFVSKAYEYDVTMILYPTVATEPPRVEEATGSLDSRAAELEKTVLNATPSSLFGTPSISLPVGRSERTGVPLGLTFEDLEQNDARLLDTLHWIEATLIGSVQTAG